MHNPNLLTFHNKFMILLNLCAFLQFFYYQAVYLRVWKNVQHFDTITKAHVKSWQPQICYEMKRLVKAYHLSESHLSPYSLEQFDKQIIASCWISTFGTKLQVDIAKCAMLMWQHIICCFTQHSFSAGWSLKRDTNP